MKAFFSCVTTQFIFRELLSNKLLQTVSVQSKHRTIYKVRTLIKCSFNVRLISQVNMIKDDGTVIHFNNPKVQASLSANTFAITGHAETKQLTEMLPGILSQLGADSLSSLRKLAEQFPRQCECTHELHSLSQSQEYSLKSSALKKWVL